MIIEAILSALLPVAAEGIQAGARRLFGTGKVKPLTVEEQIKLDNSDLERLKIIAQLDTPTGTPSQWVIDLRAASRYIAAWASILIGSYMIYEGAKVVGKDISPLVQLGGELVSIAFGFMFGSRIVANWKSK